MRQKLLVCLLLSLLLPVAYGQGLLKYNPPKTTAPLTLSGGGTRGFVSQPVIKLLAPRHLSLTSQPQPVLYWYSALAKQQKFLLTISKEASEEVLWQQHMDNLPAVGLHSLRLADYGVSLTEGVVYRWSVAIDDTEQAEGEAISNETFIDLTYQKPEVALIDVEHQAAAGYWFDALKGLIESHSPQANELLTQVGIKLPNLY